MDLIKIATFGEEIYNSAKFLSPNNTADVERLKELAIALFAELDNNNE